MAALSKVKKPCVYCGNNPVPHLFYWYTESLNILLTPVRQKLLYNSFSGFLKKRNWDLKLAESFLSFGEAVKIIGRQNDIAKCKVRRAQVLWEEAQKRGIVMEELLLFGKPFDCYISESKNKEKIIFSGLPRPNGYINNRLDLIDDKWLFKKMMIDNGLPVPMGASCSKFAQAKKVFNQIQKPVIVKPRAGSRGRHSTTFIYSQEELKAAFKIAKQLCYWVIVEEQLMGPVYRATVINFELAGVLRGDSPQITGDGQTTIEGLIAKKNLQPHTGVKDIIIDSQVELFLSRQHLELSSVPKNAQVINLSEKIGVNYGGSSSEDFDICHPDNKDLFISAAKVLGDPILGFDFIIPDITKSFKEQKCGFIEVNTLPFINLHHDPLHGQPRNVAAKIWDMLGW